MTRVFFDTDVSDALSVLEPQKHDLSFADICRAFIERGLKFREAIAWMPVDCAEGQFLDLLGVQFDEDAGTEAGDLVIEIRAKPRVGSPLPPNLDFDNDFKVAIYQVEGEGEASPQIALFANAIPFGWTSLCQLQMEGTSFASVYRYLAEQGMQLGNAYRMSPLDSAEGNYLGSRGILKERSTEPIPLGGTLVVMSLSEVSGVEYDFAIYAIATREEVAISITPCHYVEQGDCGRNRS